MTKPKDYELKIIHSEILRGLSKFKLGSSFVYIKHSKILDEHLYEERRAELTKTAIENSIPYEEDKIKTLIDLGIWSEENEAEIRNEKLYLENLQKTSKKVFRKLDIENIENQINKSKAKLYILQYHKSEVLGLTLEKFVSSRLQHFYILYSLYKDDKFLEPFVSYDEYNDLDDDYVVEIFKKYNSEFAKFSAQNLKHIAISNFFLDGFYICDNDPMKYYGKPVIDLTTLQVHLFQNGAFFKRIFEEGGDKIPEDWRDDPEKLEDWYNASDARKDLLEKTGNSHGVGIVTKDKDDLKKLGIQTSNEDMKYIKEQMKKHGGKLSFNDYIEQNKQKF